MLTMVQPGPKPTISAGSVPAGATSSGSGSADLSSAAVIDPRRLLDPLRKWWGYPGFRPLQSEAMTLVLQDRDSLVVLPTGGGKSLCYQVPALARPGLAVIVSPLISLMKDQVDSLQALGVPAACINSSQSGAEKSQVAAQIRRRELKLLYISPERLVQPATLDFLRDAGLSFVAIDEAHCISQWGHDFRPEYRQLQMLKQHFPGISVHGYTATATPQVRQDIVLQLGLQQPEILVGSFDRPNLVYRVERRVDSIGQIRRILDRHKGESGVIYCISRRNVESVSSALNQAGYKTLPYHAGLSDDDRRRGQEAFIDESINIIVATVAFGMGIDKSNVRFVIHAEMPKSLEHYQQESGRAGRDGLEAECTLLFSASDVETWTYLMKDTTDDAVREAAEESLRSMRHYCSSIRCRHSMLVEHFGQKLEKPACSACDVCLQEMAPVADSLIVAQKILSCVVRLQERYGASYTAQVLKGSKARRILENRHEQLSTWGLLRDDPETQIRVWIDQLTSQGFLRQTGEYNCLQVTPSGRQLLRGQAVPALLRTRSSENPAPAASAPLDSWEGVDRNLFNELRGLRTRLAVQRGLPPYIIFSDNTLRSLARHRPSTAAALASIPGIGEKKLNDFGAVVLFEIQQWCQARGLPFDVDLPGTQRPAPSAPPGTSATGSASSPASTGASGLRPSAKLSTQNSDEYYDLFEQELSIEEVAVQLDRSLDSVSRHLSAWLQIHRRTDLTPWVSPSIRTRIEESLGRLGAERLKPLFEDLQGAVAYHVLRVVVTVWQIEHDS
ncbi:MAG: DNA helicase RecQ [Planctomycetota bacterium]